MIDLGGWRIPDSSLSLAAAALFQEAVRAKCIWFLRKAGGESYRTESPGIMVWAGALLVWPSYAKCDARWMKFEESCEMTDWRMFALVCGEDGEQMTY
jgi:hypothetical protein